MKSFSLVFIVALIALNPLFAATVAILDSGVDFSHSELKDSRFINSHEVVNGLDDDNNGYIDDISGWNFITMDPSGFPGHLYPHFDEDYYRYYEVRKRRSLDIATEEEEEWYQEKRKDDEFQEIRKIFRRSIHATHVAGLATGLGLKQVLNGAELPHDFQKPKILNVTYLGDALQGPAVELEFKPLSKGSRSQKEGHLKSFLNDYLAWQKNKLSLAISYAQGKAQIVNASFGISYKSAGNMVEEWWQAQFPQKSKKVQMDKLLAMQDDFRSGLLRITKEVVEAHPHVLFVFSAGNGNDPTEKEIHYPSGVKCDRCLTVGASLGTKERASFSNYGKTSVSLFAPGVAMESSIPQGRYLPVNGTSQAAPQVSFTAANIIDTAISQGQYLNLASVKSILLNSVDKVEGLKESCQSGGILNPLRAIRLTKLLSNHSWSRAIRLAYQQVKPLSFTPKEHSFKEALSLENDELFIP